MKKVYLEWDNHPLRESFVKSLLLIMFLILLSIVLFLAFFNLILVFVMLFILVMSLRSFFFKTSYYLSKEEIKIKMLYFEYKKNIDTFKRLYLGDDAFLLSPFSYKTKLNKYRGVYANFPKDIYSKIEDLLKGRLEIVKK